MRQKLQFYSTCVCILLPLILIGLYIRMNPLAFMDDEAPFYHWNKEITNTPQEKYYDVIILGDSVANAAYMPALLSDGTLNLSLGGTTPVENYYTMRDWLDHNPAPDVCYISYIDRHFKEEDCFWTRIMYTKRYRLDQILEMMKAAIEYQEPSILTENYLLDFIGYELCWPEKYMTTLVNAGFNQRYDYNLSILKAGERYTGRHIAKSTAKEYAPKGTITYDNFGVNPLFDDYYRRTIELCLRNGITVRIVKLPFPDNSIYTDHYRDSFYHYYEALKEDYPEITVDWFPNYDRKYFMDRGHVNIHGTLRFSTELKAMYPDDFGSAGLSLGQVAAINDSIMYENKVDEILRWIDGRDYTVVICDRSGAFETVYHDEISRGFDVYFPALPLIKTEFGDDIADIYCISGDGGGKLPRWIQTTEDQLIVQLGEGNDPEWEMVPEGMLGVMVIDNYNQSAVCEKVFQYADGTFVLS